MGLRADVVERFAEALHLLAVAGPSGLSIAALWLGDKILEDIPVSPEELRHIARTTGLQQNRRYVVSKAA